MLVIVAKINHSSISGFFTPQLTFLLSLLECLSGFNFISQIAVRLIPPRIQVLNTNIKNKIKHWFLIAPNHISSSSLN